MRPVDKGNSPRVYSEYNQAKEDLINKIGCYCSYCEMPIKNMPEVEHVVPVHNGGASVDWKNFLLSCKYCNVNKSDHNNSRVGYLWPDEDNTFFAFIYAKGKSISPNYHHLQGISKKLNAYRIIKLCKLDREPGTKNKPTDKDRRWRSRLETWGVANDLLEGWEIVNASSLDSVKKEYVKAMMAAAIGHGHFSIWMGVFKNYIDIRKELIKAFKGTSNICFDCNANPIARVGGRV